MDPKLEVKCATDVIGEFGPWQRRVIIVNSLLTVVSPIYLLGSLFYAPKLKFWCERPVEFQNITLIDECRDYVNPNVSCSKWQYDSSSYGTTIVNEWDLVCDRSWLVSATTSSYQIGFAVSAILFGLFSDKFGRLLSLKVAVCTEIVAGVIQAFTFSIYQFIATRFVMGFAGYGRFLTGMLLVLEIVGVSNRAKMNIVSGCGWFLGYCLLPISAYLVPNFRHLQLVLTSYEFSLLFWLWRFPESPRWQLTNGKFKEAETTITEAALENGNNVEEVEHQIQQLKEHFINENEKLKEAKNQTLFEMWKVPKLLKYCLILYLTWFVNAFVYFGLNLNIGDLGGNLFLNCFAFAIADGLSYIFCYFSLAKFGRRILLCSTMTIAGFACLIVSLLIFTDTAVWVRVLVAVTGVFCVSSSFTVANLHTLEIIPTSLRQVGVGSCSLAARFGSVVAPFVKELSEVTHPSLTMAAFGCLALVDGIMVLLLPETKSIDIPDTIEEATEKAKIHCQKSESHKDVAIA